jgi:hypothetical protein
MAALLTRLEKAAAAVAAATARHWTRLLSCARRIKRWQATAAVRRSAATATHEANVRLPAWHANLTAARVRRALPWAERSVASRQALSARTELRLSARRARAARRFLTAAASHHAAHARAT